MQLPSCLCKAASQGKSRLARGLSRVRRLDGDRLPRKFAHVYGRAEEEKTGYSLHVFTERAYGARVV